MVLMDGRIHGPRHLEACKHNMTLVEKCAGSHWVTPSSVGMLLYPGQPQVCLLLLYNDQEFNFPPDSAMQGEQCYNSMRSTHHFFLSHIISGSRSSMRIFGLNYKRKNRDN